MNVRGVRFLAVAILFCCLLSTVHAANVSIVNKTGSIREAVERAMPGDRVLVESGTYNEMVEVDRALELWGVDTGGGKPVVCGNGSGISFNVSGSGVWLDGFVLNGSGISILSGRNIVSNTTIVGGDILLPVRTGGMTIRDNVLDGGNLSVTSGTVMTISGNVFVNGSILLNRSYDMMVRDNLIAGGGISLAKVADSAFFDNTIAGNVEGCAIDAQGSFCNLIAGNTIRGCGCGIRLGQSVSASRIYLNTFVNNTVDVSCAENLSAGSDLWSSPGPVVYVLNGSAFVRNLGNYWCKCNGTDGDGDGVFEEAYPVEGSGGIDPFPLAFPEEEYTVIYADERS